MTSSTQAATPGTNSSPGPKPSCQSASEIGPIAVNNSRRWYYYHVADCQTESEAEIFSKVVDGFDRRETLKREILSAQDLVEERLERYRVVLRDEIKKLCADS